jgi:endonuclease III
MDGIGLLMVEGGSFDPQLKIFAMLVCLILSAASTDSSCIEGTIMLHKAKLLTVNAMADAAPEVIMECIKKGGIHMKRAVFLK